MSVLFCGNCGTPIDSQCQKVRGFRVCSTRCGDRVEEMFREGEKAEREGKMSRYAIASAALNGHPWHDTESVARRVAEWASDNLYKKPRPPLRINPKMILDEALGTNWSEEIKRGKQLRSKIRLLADWACDHMVVDPTKCWACLKPTVSFYRDLPVCSECLRKCGQPDPQELSRNVQKVMETIDAVYGASAARKPRVPHRDVCSNPKIRHSYMIRIPTGYLMYDGTTVAVDSQADKWTREEVGIERHIFDEIGTPVSVTRVIR